MARDERMLLGFTAPLFAEIQLWDDRGTPRPGLENMALDEALLIMVRETPVLRAYRWAGPALSFGYFQKHKEVLQALLPGECLVRRWTGGGLVHHAGATTWSLIVPHQHAFAQMRPAASYARLHQVVGQMLEQAGWDGVAVVSSEAPAPAGGLCAEAPSPGDVIWKGKKVAGAGQRRTRQGLLHQGVMFLPEDQLPQDYPCTLAAALAHSVMEFKGLSLLAGAPGRYAGAGWNTQR